MQINRNNYEAFFLDYTENTLNEKGRQELALFLNQNPDLQDEFFEFENVSLKPDTRIVFVPKTRLKKFEINPHLNIDQDNYDNWIIAYLEGELNGKEIVDFGEFRVKNPIVEKEITAYEKTFLKPKTTIVFRDKELLKRKAALRIGNSIVWYVTSLAAILIIAFGIYHFRTNQNIKPINQQAQKVEIPAIRKEKPSTEKNNQPGENIRKPEPVNASIVMKAPVDKGIARIRKVNNLKNEFTTSEPVSEKTYKKFSDLVALNPVDPPVQFAINAVSGADLSDREEFSAIFDDMLLRDAINEEMNDGNSKKSVFGRIIANLGKKILNSRSDGSQEPAIINSFAMRGKEALLEIADGLPIYSSIKKDDQSRTVFAVGENLSIGLSRRNEKHETLPDKP